MTVRQIRENQVLKINVLANDSDPDCGDDICLVLVSGPKDKGQASIANNKVVFDPGKDFDYVETGQTETVILTYKSRDNHNFTATATLKITIQDTNDRP